MHWLNDPEYKKSEQNRYEMIDRERRAGLRAGCTECNRRDAHPSIGICYRCEAKLRAEARYLGIDLDATATSGATPAGRAALEKETRE